MLRILFSIRYHTRPVYRGIIARMFDDSLGLIEENYYKVLLYLVGKLKANDQAERMTL